MNDGNPQEALAEKNQNTNHRQSQVKSTRQKPSTTPNNSEKGSAFNANLNRVLVVLSLLAWFGWLVLRYVSELSWILAAIPLFIALLIFLYPNLKKVPILPGFRHSLVTAGLTCLFTIGVMVDWYMIAGASAWQTSLEANQIPVNINQRYDFEGKLDEEITLDICSLDPLYQNCFNGTDRLSLDDQGFSGQHSLAAVLQLNAEKGQIYSVNFPVSPPIFIETVSAHVYLPGAAKGSTIRLLAKVYGKNDWKYKDYLVEKPGWMKISLEVQSSPAHDVNIEEVDVDLLLPPASVSTQIETRIDDIEMFYNPLSIKPTFSIDPIIEEEVKRVRKEHDFELGIPTGPARTETSPLGNLYQVQTFEYGEVYARDGQAYAIYGPIYEKYERSKLEDVGYPTGDIQKVVSWLRTPGEIMEFEGVSGKDKLASYIYSSELGSAITKGQIEDVYEENGGPTNWLGLPIGDPAKRDQSEIQLFENGYIVEYSPLVDGKPAQDRKPVAFAYIGGSMKVIDVRANVAAWQDTGIKVEPGQRVHIVHLGGMWRYFPEEDWLDANGSDTIWEKSPMSTAPHGALIGRIGESEGDIFEVGRWKVVKPKISGRLYLMMNDDVYQDNEGMISVQVFIYED